jgi:ubiquinone/menaquinone biosynthesis C-methylase UbiE
MAYFDAVALQYDNDFSQSEIGTRMRNIVWNMLADSMDHARPLDILEINCGTGEDAVRLSNNGHNIIATDVSGEMINVARSKAIKDNLKFEVCSYLDVGERFRGWQFDLVFSNFGGLNCANENELKQVLMNVNKLLKPGGKLIAVIMGTRCVWEMLYYSLKGQFKNAFRRQAKGGIDTTLDKQELLTYYYSPMQVSVLSPASLKFINSRPVGFFLPPTYLEGYFKKHRSQLNFLNYLEKKINSFGILANMGDHFMIEMKKEA